jgi:phosphatidylglycerophosphatase A
MKPDTDTANTQLKKPVVAFAAATSFGVGYLPKAPGTFGSLAGCLLTVGSVFAWRALFFFVLESVLPHDRRDYILDWMQRHSKLGVDFWVQMLPFILLSFVISVIGVWSASRVAGYAKIEDPQYVVIDEVSGQHLTYFLGLTPLFLSKSDFNKPDLICYGTIIMIRLFNWKCLLLGFILFRLFDIWKPFPARQLERLPGGWGIMADDWMAAVYAAIVLQVALHFRVI